MKTSRPLPLLTLATALVLAATILPDLRAASTGELIVQLADPDRAADAAAELARLGDAAVPRLAATVRPAADVDVRGWAVVALDSIDGARADDALAELTAERTLPPLVRTWAAAARVRRVRDVESLVALMPILGELPALDRPWRMRLAALGTEGLEAGDLIRLTTRQPQLSQSLSEAILRQGAPPLVTVMLTGGDQNVRRQAAGYLATLAQRSSPEAAATATTEALTFEPGAKDVPWRGGPLFLPSLAWDEEQAFALASQLIAWHLFCDLRGLSDAQNQVHNNLRSLGLANAAGYRPPSRNTTEEWLFAWGRVVGRRGLRLLLERQSAPGSYFAVLERM